MLPDSAFAYIRRKEGGYVDHPADRGGETYCGIARRFWPDWEGWIVIDAIKAKRGPIPRGTWYDTLTEDVNRFYYEHFWLPAGAHMVTDAIALELYEQAVHFGVHTAVAILQRAVNALNRGGRDWDDIREDGRFGPRTATAVQACMGNRGPGVLLKALNILQGARYFDIASSDPSQEVFLHGWLKRVSLGNPEVTP